MEDLSCSTITFNWPNKRRSRTKITFNYIHRRLLVVCFVCRKNLLKGTAHSKNEVGAGPHWTSDPMRAGHIWYGSGSGDLKRTGSGTRDLGKKLKRLLRFIKRLRLLNALSLNSIINFLNYSQIEKYIKLQRCEFIKENKKEGKKEGKHALDQETDQENDKESFLFLVDSVFYFSFFLDRYRFFVFS